MCNNRNRTLALTALTLALLSAAVLPSTAVATDWSIFAAGIDTSDLSEAFGVGFRGSFPIKENLDFDITAQYFEDFHNHYESGPSDDEVEVGFIPLDFGITWSRSTDGGFTAGGGLTYAFLDIGGLEFNGMDVPDFGEADDEFGYYGKFGYRARGGFFVDVIYRALNISIKNLQLPVQIPELTKIDLTMDGWQVNAGYRF